MVFERISLDEIFGILEKDLISKNSLKKTMILDGVSSINKIEDKSIIFLKNISKENLELINKKKGCLIITQDKDMFDIPTIQVKNSRLSMAKVLNYILKKRTNMNTNISEDAFVSKKSIIGEGVKIENFAYVDKGVKIGKNTLIKQGAIILSGVEIGEECVIRENSVIGGQGFGVETDEDGNNYKIPHFGGVIIENFVEIGALNTVVSGTIDPTIVGEHSKTDDHVHIAHNCIIGKNVTITAGAVLCGSVTLSDGVYVGPNSVIKNKISINKSNFIAMSTTVTKNIEGTNDIYVGIPARKYMKK